MCTVEMSPGKFEGETCITIWAHDMVGNGCQDDTDYGPTPYVDYFNGPFTKSELAENLDDTGDIDSGICQECLDDMLGAQRIRYWEDDNGFAYSEVQPIEPIESTQAKFLESSVFLVFPNSPYVILEINGNYIPATLDGDNYIPLTALVDSVDNRTLQHAVNLVMAGQKLEVF